MLARSLQTFVLIVEGTVDVTEVAAPAAFAEVFQKPFPHPRGKGNVKKI